MAGNVDHVVDAAGDPVVAVFIAAAAVAGEVLARVGLEIGVDETLMIAEHCAHLARPDVGDAQISGARALEYLAFASTISGLHAEERQRRRAGLLLDRAGQRRDQDAAGLGLPPRIDDRATAIADDAVIPLPRFRIDRLADGAEQPQRFTRRLLHRLFAPPHQRADRGRRGVEDVDLVLVDDFPEARHARVVRHAFEHQLSSRRWRAARRRCTVAGDPTDVRGAPVDVAIVIVEHVLVGDRRIDQVAAGGRRNLHRFQAHLSLVIGPRMAEAD